MSHEQTPHSAADAAMPPRGAPGSIQKAVRDLLVNGDLSIEEAANRHYHPSFRQRINGHWDDRATVVNRLEGLRKNTAEVSIQVLDELSVEDRYAERHIIDLLTTDGQHVTQEVYLFAQRGPDGRFIWIDELSQPINTSARETSPD